MSDRRDEIRQRLGSVRFGTGAESRTLAEATDGEELVAVVGAMWRRHGWLVAATPTALHLARQPRMLGRREQLRLPWSALRDFQVATTGLTLDFAGTEVVRVELAFAGPNEELAKLASLVREHSGRGVPGTSIEELQELARRKLGRTLAFGYEMGMEVLVDRLEDDERVERLAVATRGFTGLLVLTDRRLLLFHASVRRSRERMWELGRAAIEDAADEGDVLVLRLAGGLEERFTEVVPAERAAELAVVLARRGERA